MFIEMVSTMCDCVCQVKVDEFIEMVSTVCVCVCYR